MFLFCLVFAMFCARLFICASWSPAGKELTSWLSFVVSSVSLSLSHWYPGSGEVLDCIDSWSLQPYLPSLMTSITPFFCSGVTAALQESTSAILAMSCKTLSWIVLPFYHTTVSTRQENCYLVLHLQIWMHGAPIKAFSYQCLLCTA